jgi:predicted restriction endonuclease
MKGIDVFEKRRKDCFWGIRDGATHKLDLRAHNRILFYLAGREGYKFIGAGTLASGYDELREEEYQKVRQKPFFEIRWGARFSGIEKWEPAVPVHPLLSRLELTKDYQDTWGVIFHHSIVPISEKDYKLISGEQVCAEVIAQTTEEPVLTTEAPKFSLAKRKALSAEFRRIVTEKYGSCAICGTKMVDRLGRSELQCCHIFPRAKNGSNDPRNGIRLCRLHHWAFDSGLFSISDDYRVIVEKRIAQSRDYAEVTKFQGREIITPTEQNLKPHGVYLKQHRLIHGFELLNS